MSKAILVAGLAFGDEGKGATVDFLCRQLSVDLVVRYNGGSQAAHNVVTPEGVHHCFSQFGAGMLANNLVRTHLSRFMLVDPLTMMNEAEALQSNQAFVHGVWNRTTVDPRCVIITPFHKHINRLREQARGDARHGSCGMGVGAAREWSLKYPELVLYAGDLLDFTLATKKLRFLRDLVWQEVGVAAMDCDDFALLDLAHDYCRWPVTLQSHLPGSDLAVFEGAQGVLLDETHGEAPYNTWTDCTFTNAETLCTEAGITDITKIGCLRTYHTRHGAGPFNSFENGEVPEPHNEHNEWQGGFKSGPMDFALARKALGIVGGADFLAVSHLDVRVRDNASSYVPVIKDFEGELGVRVGITANGPTANHRQFTEAWTR